MSEIYVPLPEVTMAEGLGGKEKDFYVIKHVLCFCVKRPLLVMQTMNEVNKSQIFPHGRLLASVVLCALVLMVSGCGGGAASSSGCTRMVTVSVPPLEYFVRAIAGDSVAVNTLMDANSDPETFQPGMGLMRNVNRSDLLMVTGVIPFENDLVKGIGRNVPDLKICDVGKGVEYMYGTHSHSHGEAVHAEEPHSHNHAGEPDPHIWSSVKNARIISDNMLARLSEAYPDLAGYFSGRHGVLKARLDSLDAEYVERLAAHPAFVIWHPSLSYFARDYGLEQIAFNLENKETSPLRLRQATDHALDHAPAAFFVPAGLPANRVTAISDILGLEPVEVNLMDADWEGQMELIVDTLVPEKQ